MILFHKSVHPKDTHLFTMFMIINVFVIQRKKLKMPYLKKKFSFLTKIVFLMYFKKPVQDLGCGWGSFGLYICERFPKCHVTCVSNSNTQRQFIQSLAQTKGFSDRLEVVTADANMFITSKRYDRIVSIEMFEVSETILYTLCYNDAS